MTSFTDTASFSGDTQIGDSPFGFDNMASASQTSSSGSQLQGFGNSPSPIQSIGETYNIHGTYTYLRDDGKTGDLISAFRDENTCTPAPTPGSPQDTKFSSTSMFHYGQAYQAFPDEITFMKQQGSFAVDNPDYYPPKQQQQQQVQQQGQQHGSSSSSTGFPSPSPTEYPYPPDQKDVVFQNLPGFQGNQAAIFGDRAGYQGYQAGFYDNQRLTETNFNFQLPHAGMFRDGTGVNVHGRGPYQRRGSLTNPER